MTSKLWLATKGLATATLLLAGCAGAEFGGQAPDDQAEKPELERVTQAVNDSFTTNRATTTADVATDGNGNVLVLWEGSDGQQIVGQVFSASTGAPVSTSRIYTTGSTRKHNPRVAFGSGKYLVTYVNDYTACPPGRQTLCDMDIEGMFVRTDGTLESSFHIDFSGNEDDLPRVVALSDRNQFYVTFARRTAVFAPGDGLGTYVNPDGTKVMGSKLLTGNWVHDLAYAPGNIMMAWYGASTSSRGHMAPGATALQSQILIGTGIYPSLAFSPTLGRFGLAVWHQSGSNSFEVRTQTLPSGCFTANCSGLTPLQVGLTNTQIGASVIISPEVSAAGNHFQFVVANESPGYKGLASGAFGASGFVHTIHGGTIPDAGCGSAARPFGGASLGSQGAFAFSMPCGTGPAVKGLKLSQFSGADLIFNVSN